MKEYLTDRLIPDSDKASGYSNEEGPVIEARDIESAKDMAESYGVRVVGILIESDYQI